MGRAPYTLSKAGPVLAAFLFALAALAPPAFAQGRTLTLDEAYSLAFEHHESIGIAREDINQARADLGKATARILPNLTAEGSYTVYSESKTSASGVLIQPESATNAEIRLTQPLYSGGREWATRRQARLQIQSGREGLEGAREAVMLDTARAYYGVLKALKDVEIKGAALKRAEERTKVAEARFRVGEVTRSAVLRAEAEEAGAEAELTRAGNTLKNAKVLLRRLTGVEGGFTVAEPAARPAPGADPERLLATALQSRKDFRQRQLEQTAASEGINIAWAGFKPSLRLEGLYSWRDQEPQTTFFQEESTSGTLRLTYPIFEGFLRKAELGEARSRLREAELRTLSLRRSIEVQVNEAANNLGAISALIESFRRQAAFADEDYRMVFEQFKFGVATTLDVIDADTTLVSAESSLANAVYDLEIAKLELLYVTGTLLEGAR